MARMFSQRLKALRNMTTDEIETIFLDGGIRALRCTINNRADYIKTNGGPCPTSPEILKSIPGIVSAIGDIAQLAKAIKEKVT